MRQLRAVVLLFACACPCAAPALAAEKLPPLDAEFLEYLGSFGSDEEDWALFADDDDEEPPAEPPPAKQPVAKRDGSKTEAAAKPAAEKR
ncbi:MAG TPA: hypothetical protein VFV69_23930 [Steroidobacteraceae bacterium]|jgi:hypothetical protein|nr:hypothetical protein [Steroidobacteraceae bacterium]